MTRIRVSPSVTLIASVAGADAAAKLCPADAVTMVIPPDAIRLLADGPPPPDRHPGELVAV